MLNVEQMPGICLDGMSDEEWRARRLGCIGGSEIGAILGFNQYKTALQVYKEKRGLSHLADISDKDAVYWGTVLEPVVANEFARRTGKKVAVLSKILFHPEHPYMTANIDRDICGEDAGLECKTCSAYGKDEWEGEEIPASYILQCQWYMMVSGASLWYIACLIGGQSFKWKPLKRDDELIEIMENAAVDFWENHVLPGIPPLASAGDIKEFDVKVPDTIRLPDTANNLLIDLMAAKESYSTAEKKKKDLEAKVKQLLDGHSKGVTGMFRVSWTQSEYLRFDETAFKAANPALAGGYQKVVKRDNGVKVEMVG